MFSRYKKTVNQNEPYVKQNGCKAPVEIPLTFQSLLLTSSGDAEAKQKGGRYERDITIDRQWWRECQKYVKIWMYDRMNIAFIQPHIVLRHNGVRRDK